MVQSSGMNQGCCTPYLVFLYETVRLAAAWAQAEGQQVEWHDGRTAQMGGGCTSGAFGVGGPSTF